MNCPPSQQLCAPPGARRSRPAPLAISQSPHGHFPTNHFFHIFFVDPVQALGLAWTVQAKLKSRNCGLSRLNPEIAKPAKRDLGTILARPTKIVWSRLNPNFGKKQVEPALLQQEPFLFDKEDRF